MYMRPSTMKCCWQHRPLAAAAPAAQQPLAVVAALEEVHQVRAAVLAAVDQPLAVVAALGELHQVLAAVRAIASSGNLSKAI